MSNLNDAQNIEIIDEITNAEIVNETANISIVDELIISEIIEDSIYIDIVTDNYNSLSIDLIKRDLDISSAINKSHNHDNLLALNKIGLDENEKLTWFGQKLENSLDIATEEISGLMNFEDKILLNSLNSYINNFTQYIHPEFHEPSTILQNSNNRFVSDVEKIAWNNKWDYDENIIKNVKVNNSINSDTVNGFTVEIDVPSNALFTDTIYVHPSTHPASIITESASRRFVTDVEKSNWNAKWNFNEETIKNVKVNNSVNSDNSNTVNGFTVEIDVPSNALFTDTIYTHPETHPASIITESISRRFVTDVEKSNWNAKWNFNEETIKNVKVNNSVNSDNSNTVNGLTVETAVPANALFTDTIYVHPSTHPASIITESISRRFVTDVEKSNWNAKWNFNEETIKNVKVNNSVNSDTVNGFIVNKDVPSNALFTDTIYTHPETHPASIITESASRRFVTDVEKSNWNAKWDYNEIAIKQIKVNNSINSDKVNGLTVETAVPANALFTDTIYTHPSTHPASIIIQNSTNRFVTDSEKTYWNSKWNYDENVIKNVKVLKSINSDKVNGLTVETAVPANALFTDTIYTHPEFHEPSIILQNSNNRFVTDAEKSNWNAKWDYNEAAIKQIKVNRSINSDNANNSNTVNGLTVETAVPANALFTDTIYTHPETHPASIITESASRRFVTDVEKSNWNAKESVTNKGIPNGYAALNSSGVVPINQLPNSVKNKILFITNYVDIDYISEADRDNKIVFVLNENTAYIWDGAQWITLSSVQELDWSNITNIPNEFNPISHNHSGEDIVSSVSNALKLTTPVTIELSGDVVGSSLFDGSSNINIETTCVSGGGFDELPDLYIEDVIGLEEALISKADNSISLIAGDGLSGGGTLTASRTITLGTPNTVTPSSNNTVTNASHTHAITGFSLTSHSHNLLGLDDVNTIGLEDKNVLVWDNTNSVWKPYDLNTVVSKSFTAIDGQLEFDISDIWTENLNAISVFANGLYQLETYDFNIVNTEFEKKIVFTSECYLGDTIIVQLNNSNGTISMIEHSHSLNGLSDVSLNLFDGYILIWNSTTSKWDTINPRTIEYYLSNITDVSTSSINNNDVLAWNSVTSKWENKEIVLGSVNKSELNMEENSIVFTEKTNASSSGSVIIDWSKSNHQTITLTEDTTITFTNPVGVGNFTLRILQDNVGGHSITFPTFKTSGGLPINITMNSNAEDILMLYFDGTNYIASLLSDIK